MGKDKEIVRKNDSRVDELELAMMENYPAVDLPLKHYFTKGLYCREIFMPKGTLLTSKIHKTQHQFNISKGKVAVSVDGGEWVTLEAPFHGITNPGTRRIIYIIEDCIWTTFHPLDFINGEENEWSEENKSKLADQIVIRVTENHISSINGLNMDNEYKKSLSKLNKIKNNLK
jgi:hypothetical protein